MTPGPDGMVITNDYGTTGYLTEVDVTPYGGSATPFATWTGWDAYAHPTQIQNGSGGTAIATTRGYDAGTGWLNTIQAGTSVAFENVSYQYDRVGNVTTRTDLTQSPSLAESFTYDGLNRLCMAALSLVGADR